MNKTIKVNFKDLSKHTNTPVFAYCRKLIKEGVSPETELEVYRGEMLCLTIRGIGIGAGLTVKEEPKLRWGKYREGYKKIIVA